MVLALRSTGACARQQRPTWQLWYWAPCMRESVAETKKYPRRSTLLPVLRRLNRPIGGQDESPRFECLLAARGASAHSGLAPHRWSAAPAMARIRLRWRVAPPLPVLQFPLRPLRFLDQRSGRLRLPAAADRP